MGRVIPDVSGGGDFNPTAFLKEEGAMLKGVMMGKRDVQTTYGLKPVYTLKVLDASCRFTKDKQDTEPNEGALVDFFAPTRLARQLVHVNEGETVTILYKGTKKVGRGNPAHIFAVTID